jgi:hypothetical protein
MNNKNNKSWLILIVMSSIIGGSASVLSFFEIIVLSLVLASIFIGIYKLLTKT